MVGASTIGHIEQATTRLHQLLLREERRLGAGEWRELMELVRETGAPHANDDVVHAFAVRRALLNEVGRTAPGWEGWKTIDAFRVRELYPTSAAREALLDEVLATPRDRLTRSQLHSLHGLIELGADRPHRLRPIGSDVDAAWMAERVGEGRQIGDVWLGWEVLDEAVVAGAIPADEGKRAAWLSAQLAQRRATGESGDALRLVLARRHDLLPDTPDTATQLAKAVTMLDVVGTLDHATPAEVRPAFAAAWDALTQARPTAGEFTASIDEALARVEHNLARIDGVAEQPEPGYLNFPDFADAGRIRSTLELIERSAAAPQSTTSGAHLPW